MRKYLLLLSLVLCFGAVTSAQDQSASAQVTIEIIEQVISGTSVQLQWVEPQPVEEAWSVDSYNIYRSEVSGGPYAMIGAVESPMILFTDVTVQPKKKYFYVITSVNLAGESPFTPEVVVQLP